MTLLAQESVALRLFNAAFERPRTPRSDAYKEGVLYILRLKAGETTSAPGPYPAGTAEADAWFSGQREGQALWRNALEAQQTTAAAQPASTDSTGNAHAAAQ